MDGIGRSDFSSVVMSLKDTAMKLTAEIHTAMKFEILDYKVKSPKPAIWSKATK